MSSFGTFLTNGPYGRHKGKMDFHQRFLRNINKEYPKAIRPKASVNVNPVVQYMNNKENEKKEKSLKYTNCSQIVPTVGLSNLIFYDCDKRKSTVNSHDDSISKLMTPSSSTGNCSLSQFLVPEVTIDSSPGIITDAPESPEWMDENIFEFVDVPQTLNDTWISDFPQDQSLQDFTLTSGASFLTPIVNSYKSFEMELNHPLETISMDIPQSDTLFHLGLNDPLGNYTEQPHNDTFEMDLNHQTSKSMSYHQASETMTYHQSDETMSYAIDTDSVSAPSYDDRYMECYVSQSEDESMEKFAVSSCSNYSLDISDEREFIVDFVPIRTSTPIFGVETKTRENEYNELRERNGLELSEEQNRRATSFTFSGKKSSLVLFLEYFSQITKIL